MCDEEYEKNINSLIPKAVKEASRKVKGRKNRFEMRAGADGREYRHCFWTEYFHAAMKRRAKEAGFRSC